MKRSQFITVALSLSLGAALGVEGAVDQSRDVDQYDLTAEVVFSGTIQEILRHTEKGRTNVHVVVLSDSRTLEIHLGPQHYLAWHQFVLHQGDKVEVVAAKVKGEPHFLARSLHLGRRTLAFRDARGLPLWR